MGMKTKELQISGVFLVELSPIVDERGQFCRLFCENALGELLRNRPIRQVNRSVNALAGTFRGFHFQFPPHGETKIITCSRGAVMDFALDLRAESPSFLKAISLELTEDNNRAILIPPGVAHAFQTLEDKTELLYFHDAFYSPASEGGVRFDDPFVKISLPLPISSISERDKSHAILDDSFKGLFL
jgi:dTDP-4-dehydrorhamnose 3,5-epimerase